MLTKSVELELPVDAQLTPESSETWIAHPTVAANILSPASFTAALRKSPVVLAVSQVQLLPLNVPTNKPALVPDLLASSFVPSPLTAMDDHVSAAGILVPEMSDHAQAALFEVVPM